LKSPSSAPRRFRRKRIRIERLPLGKAPHGKRLLVPLRAGAVIRMAQRARSERLMIYQAVEGFTPTNYFLGK
jgi:hypothetical protein